MNKNPIIILFGGSSDERRVSIASAQNMADALPQARLWFLSPGGTLHECDRHHLCAFERPFERDFVPNSPALYRNIDESLRDSANTACVFALALHGGEGEDGTLQQKFERAGRPFTGSGSAASRTAFDKVAAKRLAEERAIPVPASGEIRANQPGVAAVLQEWLERRGPLILKPVANGSSIGLFRVMRREEIAATVVALATSGDTPYLVETLIAGRELTIGVFDDGRQTIGLPPSEVRTEPNREFDYQGKYLGRGSLEITPAQIPDPVTAAAKALALTMHSALGCEGYSRTDVIFTDRELIYLETNTLPGLTRASFIPQQLAAAKIPFGRFLEAQIELARQRAERRHQKGST